MRLATLRLFRLAAGLGKGPAPSDVAAVAMGNNILARLLPDMLACCELAGSPQLPAECLDGLAVCTASLMALLDSEVREGPALHRGLLSREERVLAVARRPWARQHPAVRAWAPLPGPPVSGASSRSACKCCALAARRWPLALPPGRWPAVKPWPTDCW